MIGRDRQVRIGGMRHRITVQQPTTTSVQGQVVYAHSDWLTQEPADYDYVRGNQRTHGRQVEEGVDAVFRVRFRDGYTPRHRVMYDGMAHNIVFVRPIGGRDRYLELHTKVVQ